MIGSHNTRCVRLSLLMMTSLLLTVGVLGMIARQTAVNAGPREVTPLPPVETTDGRAGACYSFYYDPPPQRPFIQMARDAGARWDRFDFNWPNIEPANDAWSFDAYDTLVNDLVTADMHIIGILLWTPGWAATGGARWASPPDFTRRPFGWYAPVFRPSTAGVNAPQAASSPPQGLYLPWDHPDNHWGNFVYTVVSHYGEQVKHWEMWNEPEWNYFWTGTSGDYAQLLKVGYQATKAACADCTVLFGGLHYWANPNFYRWVLSSLDSDPLADRYNHFFDVMSVHFYSGVSNSYDRIVEVRTGMETYHVGDHPIWLTETGVPVWNDDSVDPDPTKYDFAATEEEAAAYVIQSYANSLAADVSRYLFFRTHDADMGEYFGLVRNDHSLRPAYVAYQVATTHLISPTFVTRAQHGPHRNVTLWGTPHGKVSVLWNETPTTGVYTLPATMPTATLVSRQGETRTLSAATVLSGSAQIAVYTLTLPGATANLVSDPAYYFIGGDPLLIVESETPNQPPTSTVLPLPAMTSTLTVTVRWYGRDNQAGIQVYDIQVRDGNGDNAPWSDWQWSDWQSSTTANHARFTGQWGHTYYFRSRATDRLGNREAWPASPDTYVTFEITATVHVSIGTFFADENRNQVWDPPIVSGTVVISAEQALPSTTLRLLDGSGRDIVAPISAPPWAFTTVISYSHHPYWLWLRDADDRYMRVLSIAPLWGSGRPVEYVRSFVGLWPVERVYLPVVVRNRP